MTKKWNIPKDLDDSCHSLAMVVPQWFQLLVGYVAKNGLCISTAWNLIPGVQFELTGSNTNWKTIPSKEPSVGKNWFADGFPSASTPRKSEQDFQLNAMWNAVHLHIGPLPQCLESEVPSKSVTTPKQNVQPLWLVHADATMICNIYPRHQHVFWLSQFVHLESSAPQLHHDMKQE